MQAIETVSYWVGRAVTAQYGKTGLHNRIIDRVGKRVGTALYFANRLAHPTEPYGKWMKVEVPEDMPGRDIIPDYYRIPFHGQANGYLSEISAKTYDLGVSFVFRGKDEEMRAQLVRRLRPRLRRAPKRILDIGSGTGVSTFHLARAWPEAEVLGVELSPYYVRHARERAEKLGVRNVTFLHAKGEETGQPDAHFDLVASTFVFHEVPVPFTRKIMEEAFRVLKPGGTVGICDAAQIMENRYADIFPAMLYEPYFKKYARMDWEKVLEGAGFERVAQEATYTLPLPASKTVIAEKPETAARRRTAKAAAKKRPARSARASARGKKKARA